jgi:hypothetical protein
MVYVVRADIEEMDFKDSVDGSGNATNNNFDLVDSSGNLVVTNRGPAFNRGRIFALCICFFALGRYRSLYVEFVPVGGAWN